MTRRYNTSGCSVAGCAGSHESLGFCNKHYLRYRKYGDPLARPDIRLKGQGNITNYGYKHIGINGERKFEHIIVAEKALGKTLPQEAQVHHVDGDGLNNANTNLVICPDQAYHTLLHVRQEALNQCGNANFRKCLFCKKYDDPNDMKFNPHSRSIYHEQCRRDYDRQRNHATGA